MKDKLYSTKEVMEILSITNPTLSKWIMQGKIKAIECKKGHRIVLRYTKEEVHRVKKMVRRNRINGNSILNDGWSND